MQTDWKDWTTFASFWCSLSNYSGSLKGCNMDCHSGWMTELQPWILSRPVACCIATFLLGYVSDDITVAEFKQTLVELGPCILLTGVITLLYQDTHSEIKSFFSSPTSIKSLCPLFLPHHREEWEKISGKRHTKAGPWKTFSLAVSPHHRVRLPLTQSCLLQAFTPISAPFSKCLFSLEPKTYWLYMRTTHPCLFHTPSLCLQGVALSQSLSISPNFLAEGVGQEGFYQSIAN